MAAPPGAPLRPAPATAGAQPHPKSCTAPCPEATAGSNSGRIRPSAPSAARQVFLPAGQVLWLKSTCGPSLPRERLPAARPSTGRFPRHGWRLQLLMAPQPTSTEIQSRKTSSRVKELPPLRSGSSIQPPALGNRVSESLLRLDRGLSPWDEECLWPFGLAMAPPAGPSPDKGAAGPEAGSRPAPVPFYGPVLGKGGGQASPETTALPSPARPAALAMRWAQPPWVQP